MESNEGAGLPVLDVAAVRSLGDMVGGDPATLVELVDAFLEDGPLQVEDVRRGAATNDVAVTRRAAHTLKGNARTFGATALATLCQKIEEAARAEDLVSAQAEIGELGAVWSRVNEALSALRDREAT